MLKKIIFPLLICLSTFLYAQQESQQFIKRYLVRADGSIEPGMMFKDGFSNVYINGNLEYYIDNIVSVRGDANYMMGSTGINSDSMGLKDNHSILIGTSFHFPTKGHFDPYLIVQPGIAYTSSYRQYYDHGIVDDAHKEKDVYNGVVSPIGTVGLGFNYYFQRFAHLFLETRYVHGNHLSEAPSSISLDELRITFGLGFNVFILKEKKKPS